MCLASSDGWKTGLRWGVASIFTGRRPRLRTTRASCRLYSWATFVFLFFNAQGIYRIAGQWYQTFIETLKGFTEPQEKRMEHLKNNIWLVSFPQGNSTELLWDHRDRPTRKVRSQQSSRLIYWLELRRPLMLHLWGCIEGYIHRNPPEMKAEISGICKAAMTAWVGYTS